MIKKLALFAIIAIAGIFGITQNAFAADPIYTSAFNNKALKGYDTVSYFQQDGLPVKGSKDFKTKWRGAEWLFSSQANLDSFKADPEKYAPQYGGYCAWATAHDTLAKADPLVYTLEDGKLYLNYDKSIDKRWQPRKAELIPVADKKYPELIAK